MTSEADAIAELAAKCRLVALSLAKRAFDFSRPELYDASVDVVVVAICVMFVAVVSGTIHMQVLVHFVFTAYRLCSFSQLMMCMRACIHASV